MDFYGNFPIFQTLFGPKCPHSQAFHFYLWRELRKNPTKEEPHHVSALTKCESCIRRGAAISKYLICSQTTCNIIKSFPNHTHHLANTKIKKTEQNELCQKWFLQREKCALMSPFKRNNDFCKRNNYCNHLLLFLFNTAIVSILKTRLGPCPFAPQKSCLLGNCASSHLPTPTLPLSKGISEPAIWEPGNSTFSF